MSVAKAKVKATTKGKPTTNGEVAYEATTSVISLDSLSLDPSNVRGHPEANRRATEASLTRFGPARSIVVDGKGVVRAGNGTVEAARQAGITEVLIVDPKPGQMVAVRRKEWTASEATAYSIADNRTTDLSSFIPDDLASTLRALQSEDFDLAAVGYTDDEVDALIEGLARETAGVGEAVDDPEGEWQGMPEFQHEDQTSQFRAIVHFVNEADMRAFEELVGQEIPTNTRAIWFPKAERQVVKGSGYISDEP